MVSWLANTACLRFGQVHYPRGIYVPNLLQKNDESIPHPRLRVCDALDDEDVVTVTLKDGSKKQGYDELDWYSKAFGAK